MVLTLILRTISLLFGNEDIVDIGKQIYWQLLESGTQLLGGIYGTGATIGGKWGALWFLTHLWLLSVSALLVVKYTRYDTLEPRLKAAFLLISFGIGAAVLEYTRQMKVGSLLSNANYSPGLPFSLDLLPVSLAYFLFGYTVKDRVLNFHPSGLFLILSVCCVVISHLYFQPRTSLNARILDSPFAGLVTALGGIYISLSVSHALGRLSVTRKVFSYIGSMSLFVLAFHMFLEHLLIGFTRDTFPEMSLGIGASLSLIGAIILSLAIGCAIKRTHYLSMLFLPMSLVKKQGAAPCFAPQ
jgi:fucose 4-O-acetylase-like acetyltransferase